MALFKNSRGVVLTGLLASPEFTKSRSWQTSVSKYTAGEEQRVGFVKRPVLGFRGRFMSYTATSNLREQLHITPFSPILVPDWSDAVELAQVHASGSTAFTLLDDLIAFRDFTTGNYLIVLSRDGSSSHVGVIQTIIGNVITINKASTSAFGLGDFAAPGLVGELTPVLFNEFASGNYIELELSTTERRLQFRDPLISLSTTTLSFVTAQGGPNPPNQIVTVSNVGVSGSVMHCIIDPTDPLFLVNPVTGEVLVAGLPLEIDVTEGTPVPVTVGLDNSNTSPGAFTLGIKFDTENPFEFDTVIVTLTVTF